MTYDELVIEIDAAVKAADSERRLWFSAGAVTALVDFDDRDGVTGGELTLPAREVFAEIAERAPSATADEIHEALAVIDAGTLSDGDMDAELLRALEALEARAVVLSGDAVAGAKRLAWLLLERVDYEHPASVKDFTAGPEMAATRTRILHTLNHA